MGNITNNFKIALPPDYSDMASQIFKDPYVFDFLGTAEPRREAELEQKLIEHLEKFLLELGQGFAFVGRQITDSLPENLKSSLPTIEEIEAELSAKENDE